MNTATMTLTPSTIPDLFGVTEVEEGPAETCTAETLSAAEATRAVLEAAAADEERASQAEELEGLMRSRIIVPAATGGFEAAPIGVTPVPGGPVVVRAHTGSYWTASDHATDPTRAEYGGRIPVPAEVHARLTGLLEAGVRVDHLWTAHEMPATWRPGDRYPALVPSPVSLRKMDATIAAENARAAERTIATVGRSAKVAGLAGITVATAPFAMFGSLDPVVFGGVEHPESGLVAWAVLAQWIWE